MLLIWYHPMFLDAEVIVFAHCEEGGVMSASTLALLFYGVVSADGDYDTWKNRREEYESDANGRGLLFGRLADGEAIGIYLAIKASVVEVDAGVARPCLPSQFLVSQQWRDRIQEFAEEIGLSLQAGEPFWYCACSTDRDY